MKRNLRQSGSGHRSLSGIKTIIKNYQKHIQQKLIYLLKAGQRIDRLGFVENIENLFSNFGDVDSESYIDLSSESCVRLILSPNQQYQNFNFQLKKYDIEF